MDFDKILIQAPAVVPAVFTVGAHWRGFLKEISPIAINRPIDKSPIARCLSEWPRGPCWVMLTVHPAIVS